MAGEGGGQVQQSLAPPDPECPCGAFWTPHVQYMDILIRGPALELLQNQVTYCGTTQLTWKKG